MSMYGDYADDDLDDEDAYDGLSDYDDDEQDSSAAADGPSSGADRVNEVGFSHRSSHHHMGRSNVPSGSCGRHTSHSDYRRYRTTSERLPPPDPNDDNRRDHHNHLERKRRASIKGSYSDLRESIPSLRGSKASRAVTLQRATETIITLEKKIDVHNASIREVTMHNEEIERQLAEMQREYQRMEAEEAALTASAAAAMTQPPAAFHTGPTISRHPTEPPTANSTVAVAPHPCGGSSSSVGSSNGSHGFPSICIVPHNQQNSTESNSSSSDDATRQQETGSLSDLCDAAIVVEQESPDQTSAGIPPSGLAQLSYAALHFVEQPASAAVMAAMATASSSSSSPPTSTTTITTAPSIFRVHRPMARLVTQESSSPNSIGNPTVVLPRGVRVSNATSVVAAGRSGVAVDPRVRSTATLSALDSAVLKARTSRSSTDGVGLVGSNVEVTSSTYSSSSSSCIAPTTTAITPSQQPRRVVIVSSQNTNQAMSSSQQQQQHSKLNP